MARLAAVTWLLMTVAACGGGTASLSSQAESPTAAQSASPGSSSTPPAGDSAGASPAVSPSGAATVPSPAVSPSGAPASPDPSTTVLPALPPLAAQDLAGLYGALRGDPVTQCVWIEQNGGELASVLWPPGWTARFEPLELLDAAGAVVATEGDRLQLTGSGASTGEDWTGCDVTDYVFATNSAFPPKLAEAPTPSAGPTGPAG